MIPTEYIDSTHQYYIEGIEVPSVTTILKAAGLYNEDYFTEESRTRGTYTHKACLYYLQDDLVEESIPDEYRGYVEAFKRFWAECDIEIVVGECERPLFNYILRYGGTPDIPCKINTNDSLIDIKTGAETSTTGVQLAGYMQLLNYPVRRYGLYLKATGKYMLIPYTDRNDIKIFNSALSLYHWRAERNLL